MVFDPNMTPEPVTIADRLFLELRRAILEGEIPPGKKISEPELAGQYNVSRGSLREAISKLENCNLVTRKPNIGARVVGFSANQLMEIYQIREAMEGIAARLAAENMTSEQLSHLNALLERNKVAVTTQDPYQTPTSVHYDADLDFHFCIIQGSHNERLQRMLCMDLYDLVRFYRFRLNPRFSEKALNEHELIASALNNRDGEMAELLMRHHIRASRARAQEHLATLPPEEIE
jgi:DNA-binding GntR family transcriptional regulator